jgi:DNA-binding MarR family transcriptional regulator
MSQEEISSFLEIDKAATAKALDKLQAQGYIRRAEGKEDRRKKFIFLSKKARLIQTELTSVLDDWENILFQEFNLNDREEIRRALMQIAANAAYGVQAREKFIP